MYESFNVVDRLCARLIDQIEDAPSDLILDLSIVVFGEDDKDVKLLAEDLS